MKKMLIIFALFLFLPCFANDFTALDNKTFLNNSMFRVDEKNVTLNFWLKILNGSDFYPQKTYPNDWYVMENWEVHCLDATFSVLVQHVYDKKENHKDSNYNLVINEKVIPMTMSEVFYKNFCKGVY